MRRAVLVAFALLWSSTLSGRPAEAHPGDTTSIGGRRTSIASDPWTPTSTASTPAARYAHTAIWTGSRMIVWGGNGDEGYVNDGGQYDPVTDSWTATTTTGAPSWRSDHRAVWTGSRMIVWGGIIGDQSSVNDGGQYDPVANAWTPTSTSNAPSGRDSHTAVWTGSRMIVWGGYSAGGYVNDGGQYDPIANVWTLTTTTGAPLARLSATAVWTGSRMIVWGGYGPSGTRLNDGGQYDPVADSWTATTTTGAPEPRDSHTAVWTGSRMIVWGGYGPNGDGDLGNGGQYDPAGNRWYPISLDGAPDARSLHTAVWTGSGMIVWGGVLLNNPLGDGGRYNPSTDTWWAVPATAASPAGRWGHTAVWTGSRMIAWGGYGDGVNRNDGGQLAEVDPGPPACYSLTTVVSPGGSGTVSVNTGRNCSGGFTAGTNLSLTATPQAGRAFAGWSGSGGTFSNVGANPATFRITGNASITAFFVAGGSLSVIVSVSPDPGTVNEPVTFSCNVTGGSPPYTYQWRSPSTSSFIAGTSQTFSTVSPVPTSIQAGCTAFDSAGASSRNAATVEIIGTTAPCADVNYTILDRDNGFVSIPLSSGTIGPYFGVATGQNLVFQATATGLDTVDWTFGDGGTGSGNPKWYTYTRAGTFTATATVNSNTACSKSYIFVVAGPSEPPKWFVAGLAYTAGAASGTVWQSDLTILNPHPTLSGTYSLAFLDGRELVAPKDLVWKTVTLGAQQSASASNVLGTFFGKSLGSYGAVIVRGDVVPVAPSITSRTYNNGDPGKGTFGLSVPVAQATGGVSQQSSPAQQLLIGLRDDASAEKNTGAYTNIALVNLISTDWSHAHLTFFDETGENLGAIPVDVPPYGVAQLSKPLTSAGWLNKPGRALYRVQVTVDPGGAVYPYATVIDQASTDPIVVTPTEQPLNAYRVPGIVRLAGANNTVWRSRFVLHNPSTSARKVSVLYSYVPCDATGCGGRQLSSGPGDVSMAPGETKTWDDFPAAWLTAVPGGSVSNNVSYGSSYIDVAPATDDPNQDPLLVLGETYNSQPTGPVGLQLSGFTDLDGGSKMGAGKRLLLTGLASNAGFRTNVAFVLISGTSASFHVRVLSNTGVTLRTFGWDLTGSSPFIQFSDSDLFGGVNKTEGMSIIVDSFDGSPVGAYATIIDNTSGDATFVKAQPAP